MVSALASSNGRKVSVSATRWPHFGQNAEPSEIVKPQAAHTMVG